MLFSFLSVFVICELVGLVSVNGADRIHEEQPEQSVRYLLCSGLMNEDGDCFGKEPIICSASRPT